MIGNWRPGFWSGSVFLGLWVAMASFGCSKQKEPAKEPVVVVAEANVADGSDETEVQLTEKLAAKRKAGPTPTRPKASAAAAVQPRQPGPGEQQCFQCSGLGQVTCVAPGCRIGGVPCPGPCLKRSQGTWVPDTAHGGMAAKIRLPGGGSWLINEGHAGEVWVQQGGQMVSMGPCKICRGRQVVACEVCRGSGHLPCEVCETKGVVPAAWTATDNPWFNRQPDLVRLKDGRVFLAKEAGGDDVVVIFKTRSGPVITIARDEVTQWPKKL